MQDKHNLKQPGSQGGQQSAPVPNTPASSNNASNGPGNQDHHKLHIFVNNLKFTEEDGVKATMTGRELAALVQFDADNAEITRKNEDTPIAPAAAVAVKMGDHFEVIRKRVQAGCR